MKELFTPEEAAKVLKVDPATVRIWLRQGKLKGSKLAGGHWRIDEAELERFIKQEG
jgi:excisionase family DNA binding protein